MRTAFAGKGWMGGLGMGQAGPVSVVIRMDHADRTACRPDRAARQVSFLMIRIHAALFRRESSTDTDLAIHAGTARQGKR